MLISAVLLIANQNNNQNNSNYSNLNNSEDIIKNNTNLSEITNGTEDSNTKTSQENIYTQKSNKNHGNNKAHSSSFSPNDAVIAVKKHVHHESEIIVGKPKYKNKLGWLVPIRKKDSGKFAGSVYVHSSSGPFSEGPKTYKQYKEVISKNK